MMFSCVVLQCMLSYCRIKGTHKGCTIITYSYSTWRPHHFFRYLTSSCDFCYKLLLPTSCFGIHEIMWMCVRMLFKQTHVLCGASYFSVRIQGMHRFRNVNFSMIECSLKMAMLQKEWKLSVNLCMWFREPCLLSCLLLCVSHALSHTHIFFIHFLNSFGPI